MSSSRGWLITCDGCDKQIVCVQMLLEDARKEARALGWGMKSFHKLRDFCPSCYPIVVQRLLTEEVVPLALLERIRAWMAK